MHTIKWSDLTEYIQSRDPKLLGTVQGVPLEDIRKIEQERGIKLPQFYVDFLMAMGKHEGDSHFFPLYHYHDFYRVNTSEPDQALSNRYFKIAAHTEEDDMVYLDYYLDLKRSDGVDAPLVSAEEIEDVAMSAENVIEEHDSVVEHITDMIFNQLEMGNRKEKTTIFIQELDRLDQAKKLKKEAVRILEGQGFKFALPELERFAHMTKLNMSARVEIAIHNKLIDIKIGSDDSLSMQNVVDALTKGLPGAAVYR